MAQDGQNPSRRCAFGTKGYSAVGADPEELFDRLEVIDGPTDRGVLAVRVPCARYAVIPPSARATPTQLVGLQDRPRQYRYPNSVSGGRPGQRSANGHRSAVAVR